VSSTDQATNAKYNTFAAVVEWPTVGVFKLEQVCVHGFNLSSFVSIFVPTRPLFANNEILSAVSTEFERKAYLAKMNYYPHTWRGAPRGAGPNATASVASA